MDIIFILILGGLYWLYIVKTKDYIRIEIDGVYKNNKEITIAAYEELMKKGKDCEITKLSNSFSEIKVDGKMYYVTGMVFRFSQVITLKPLRDD